MRITEGMHSTARPSRARPARRSASSTRAAWSVGRRVAAPPTTPPPGPPRSATKRASPASAPAAPLPPAPGDPRPRSRPSTAPATCPAGPRARAHRGQRIRRPPDARQPRPPGHRPPRVAPRPRQHPRRERLPFGGTRTDQPPSTPPPGPFTGKRHGRRGRGRRRRDDARQRERRLRLHRGRRAGRLRRPPVARHGADRQQSDGHPGRDRLARRRPPADPQRPRRRGIGPNACARPPRSPTTPDPRPRRLRQRGGEADLTTAPLRLHHRPRAAYERGVSVTREILQVPPSAASNPLQSRPSPRRTSERSDAQTPGRPCASLPTQGAGIPRASGHPPPGDDVPPPPGTRPMPLFSTASRNSTRSSALPARVRPRSVPRDRLGDGRVQRPADPLLRGVGRRAGDGGALPPRTRRGGAGARPSTSTRA